MRIAFRRPEIGVSEHLLDAPQVGSTLEQMCCERVTKEVGVDPLRLEPGFLRQSPENEESPGARERTTPHVEEEVRAVAAVEMRAAERQISANCLCGGSSEWHEPLFATLSEDANDSSFEVDRALLEPDGFRDTKPGAVEELDERAVAQSPRRRAGSGLDQTLGFGGRERAREAAGAPRGRDRGCRIVASRADKFQVTEVRPHSRDASRHRRWREAVCPHHREPALELLGARVADLAAAEGGESCKVAAVRVDRTRRTARSEVEEETLDVGLESGRHGDERDSAVLLPLLLRGIRRPRPGGRSRRSRSAVLGVGLLASLALAGSYTAPATASDLLARNASGVHLAVSRDGKALVTYRARGRVFHVLAWGAVDARPPDRTRPQVAFQLDYSGGWGTAGRPVWKTFRNACRPYTGPPLAWFVAACTAPDGSYWALQRWQRVLPGYGLPVWKQSQGAWELRLSHWRGPLAVLNVWQDWSYGNRFHHLFGRFTYRGHPVYGFAASSTGAALDSYGRNLYLDTYDSAYGLGWRRENGFLSRRPDGTFCYGLVPHQMSADVPARYRGTRPAGNGRRYRISVSGPGVTPDVMWEAPGLHDFSPLDAADRTHEAQMNALQQKIVAGAKPCHP
jgi:hypothetical protein